MSIPDKNMSNQIKDNNEYVESSGVYKVAKGVNHTSVMTDEVQKVLLDILIEIDRVFRKNNIGYALAFGSALGLYNYQGFIPWDDDADLAVRYEDIPLIIEAFKKDLGPDYYFDCYETDPNYNPFFPTFKVRKRNTYCVETNYWILPNRCKQGDGVFIDICALMNVPPKKEQMKIINKMKGKIIVSCILDMIHLTPHKMWKKVKQLEKDTYLKYKDTSDMVGQTVIIPYQNHRKEIQELAYPKDMIYPFKDCTFMGHTFMSFNDVKGFLEAFYSPNSLKVYEDGKWIDPYPKKKRKPDHYRYINLSGETKK